MEEEAKLSGIRHIIRQKDYRTLTRTVGILRYAYQKNRGFLGWAFPGQISFLIEVSGSVSDISYCKSGIKDRYKDIPWHHVEYLKNVLTNFRKSLKRSKKVKDGVESGKLMELCGLALPLIMEHDVPQLFDRLEAILENERQVERAGKDKRKQFTYPPFWGLENIVKLTSFFMDRVQMETIQFIAGAIVEVSFGFGV